MLGGIVRRDPTGIDAGQSPARARLRKVPCCQYPNSHAGARPARCRHDVFGSVNARSGVFDRAIELMLTAAGSGGWQGIADATDQIERVPAGSSVLFRTEPKLEPGGDLPKILSSLAIGGTAAMGTARCSRPLHLGQPTMPIRTDLADQSAFDPQAITAMSRALEETCAALQVNGQAKDREIIAARIVDLARNGVIDATALRDLVLAETKAMRSL